MVRYKEATVRLPIEGSLERKDFRLTAKIVYKSLYPKRMRSDRMLSQRLKEKTFRMALLTAT